MEDDPFSSSPITRDGWDLGSVLTDIWNSGAASSSHTSALPPPISTNWPWLPLCEVSPHYTTHCSTPTHAEEWEHPALHPNRDLAAQPETMYLSSYRGSPASPSVDATTLRYGAMASPENMHSAKHSSSGSMLSFAGRSTATGLRSGSPASYGSVNIDGEAERSETPLETECKSREGFTEGATRKHQRKSSKQGTMQLEPAVVTRDAQKGGANSEGVILKVYGKGEKARKMDMEAVKAAWKSLRENEESVTKRFIARKRRIRRLMEDAYWALQVYALLQGVLYAAVAAGDVLSCQHFRPIAALTITITFTTLTIIVTRLHAVEKEQPKAFAEEYYRRHLVAAANNLFLEPIDDVFRRLPENPLTSADSPAAVSYPIFRFPAQGFFVLFLLIGFFFVIFVSCSIMLCYTCRCPAAS